VKSKAYCPDCNSVLSPGAKSCGCGWKDHSAPAGRTRPHLCAAYGCDLHGTIAPDSGSRWYCRYHANGNPSVNDIITRVLKTNYRAVNFHNRLLRMSILEFHQQRRALEQEKFPPLPDEPLNKYQDRVKQWIDTRIREAIDKSMSPERQQNLLDSMNKPSPAGMSHVSEHSPEVGSTQRG